MNMKVMRKGRGKSREDRDRSMVDGIEALTM